MSMMFHMLDIKFVFEIKNLLKGGYEDWWRGGDLNFRPSGYEPDELPDCSTPRRTYSIHPHWNFRHIYLGFLEF